MKFFDINLRGDHYSKELIEELLEAATVFKINDAELLLLRDMFDIRGTSDDDACRWFMSEYGLDYVILTGGSTFSTIISKNGESPRWPPRTSRSSTPSAPATPSQARSPPVRCSATRWPRRTARP